MTSEDRRWCERIDVLGRDAWRRWVQPPGQRIRRWPLRVWIAFARLHRLLWRVGVEL
jgi:hypothetical protein